MVAPFSKRPAPNEVELSIFGPGYGEAIAVHLGDNNWVLVDSCIERTSGLPAALHYLLQLGIDVARDVRLIVATHWHDDHVRGIGNLYNACIGAEIVIPSALGSREFATLASFYSGNERSSLSGIDDLLQIFDILQDRKRTPKLATVDRLLWSDELLTQKTNNKVTIHALSPSDKALLLAQMEFSTQIRSGARQRRRLSPPSSNEASVALLISIGHIRLILGADLEQSGDSSIGWTAVITDSQVIAGLDPAIEKASILKVPHHGSKTGHNDEVWTRLLITEPYAVLTPFRHGRHLLPNADDLERISGLTPNAYLTAPARVKSSKWSRGLVRDFVKESTVSMEPVFDGWGQVQLRRVIEPSSATWSVRLLGDAYRIVSSA